MVGRRTCDQEVADSIPARSAAAYDDPGQVVHTHLLRRRQSSESLSKVPLLTGLSNHEVVELETDQEHAGATIFHRMDWLK